MKSFSAFTLDISAVSLWPKPRSQGQPSQTHLAHRRFWVPWSLPTCTPPASPAPWGLPNQASALLMWGSATVTWPHVCSCRHPAASVGSRDLMTLWDPCCHTAVCQGSRNSRKHCESLPFAVPAALPTATDTLCTWQRAGT